VFTLFGFSVALASTQLLALALVAYGALAAAHLVGRRRRRIVVSTLDPWSLAQGPLRRTRLGWRMQRWLAFLLHAAILLLLLLALADPRPGAGEGGGRSIALLIDRSASMAAVAGRETRLALARQEALSIAATLGPTDRVLVAGFARQLEVESEWTADRARIAAALDRIEPGNQTEDLGSALAATAALGHGRSRLEVVVLGDRHPGDLAQVSSRIGGVPVRYVPLGAPADNVGIVELSLSRAAEDPGRAEAWLRVQASRQAPGRTGVDLVSLPSGRRLQHADLDLPSAGSRTIRLPFPAAGEALVAALLRPPAGDAADALVLDDRVVAVLPPPTTRRVLLVSAGNHYLAGALRSFGAGIALDERTPSRLGPERPALEGYDVVVFDGVAPDPPPPNGRFLYLDPSGPGSPFAARGQLRDPIPTELRRDHPLLRHVSLADLNIREARRLTAGRDDVVVAAALGVPLIVARETSASRIVALGFDLRRSDLPLRPTLPLLLANALDWLAGPSGPRGFEPRTEVLDPGEVDTRQASIGRPGSPPRPDLRPGGPRPGHWFLLLALAFALFEWWAHQRRWTS
jgi:hypothetical protein